MVEMSNPNGGDISKAKPFVMKIVPKVKINLPKVAPQVRTTAEKYKPSTSVDYNELTNKTFEL